MFQNERIFTVMTKLFSGVIVSTVDLEPFLAIDGLEAVCKVISWCSSFVFARRQGSAYYRRPFFVANL